MSLSLHCLPAWCRLLPWLTNFLCFAGHLLGCECTAIDTLGCVLHTALNTLFVKLDSKLEDEKMVQNHWSSCPPRAQSLRWETWHTGRHGTGHGLLTGHTTSESRELCIWGFGLEPGLCMKPIMTDTVFLKNGKQGSNRTNSTQSGERRKRNKFSKVGPEITVGTCNCLPTAAHAGKTR